MRVRRLLSALLGAGAGEHCRYVFAVHEVAVGTGFDVAAVRLADLVSGSALDGASEAAYENGLAAVLRVGPLGGMRGFSKLVQVRFLAPVQRGGTMTVPLRWEATGAAGELFPVLDADLILARYGADQARLAIAGSYRPPFGRAGAALDRAVMHRLATATIRSLLGGIADAIVQLAPAQQPGSDTGPWQPQAADRLGGLGGHAEPCPS